jgi:hypothetical protein
MLIGVPTAQASVTATTIAVSAGDNQSAPIAGSVATSPAVLVTGAGSAPVAGVSVTFAVATGGGTLGSPATVTTGADGIATSPTWTLGATAGPNTLTATASGLTGSPVTFTATARSVCDALASNGSGTSADPFRIANQTQLAQLASNSNCRISGLHFKQTADITLSGSWTPIGPDTSTPFRGTYDGDSKSISGLTGTGSHLGLFGHTIDATLKNIRLLGVSLAVNGNFAGGLVALAQNTDILNCFVSGAITVTGYLGWFGGIAGQIEAGSLIQDTSSEVSITTGMANKVGGVVGEADQSELIRVTYGGSLTVASTSTTNHSWLGGIAGWAGDTSIQNASSSGSISGFNSVGGIVGTLQSGAPNVTLIDSSSSATVTGNNSVGGLVGAALATLAGDLTRRAGQGLSPSPEAGRAAPSRRPAESRAAWSVS